MTTTTGPTGTIDPEALRSALAEGHERLRALLPGLTDQALRAPSALPGWTRGHVLSHIEGVGLALARQARYAPRGELVELYDGGRPARDAAIEAGHGRDADTLRAAVAAALDEAGAAWAAVGADDWERPVQYTQGGLLAAGHTWWRELLIHTGDALLGPTPADWPEPFCVHLVERLAVRVPDGVRLTLKATDAPHDWTLGEGAPLTVSGRLTDIAAWLAGRRPEQALSGGPLPELGPWI